DVGGQHGGGQGESARPLPADGVRAGDGGEGVGQIIHGQARLWAARQVSSTAHPSSSTARGTRGSRTSRVMIGGPTRQASQRTASTTRTRAGTLAPSRSEHSTSSTAARMRPARSGGSRYWHTRGRTRGSASKRRAK